MHRTIVFFISRWEAAVLVKLYTKYTIQRKTGGGVKKIVFPCLLFFYFYFLPAIAKVAIHIRALNNNGIGAGQVGAVKRLRGFPGNIGY